MIRTVARERLLCRTAKRAQASVIISIVVSSNLNMANFNTGTIVHVGSLPADFVSNVKDSKTICFHDFESLAAAKGEFVVSPEFTCADFKWKLIVYPHGDEIASDGMLSVYLGCTTPTKVVVKQLSITIKGCHGDDAKRAT
jgi:hypothetical protein